jgi:hypothetical protein
MPFGKHKGTPLVDVPTGYLQWVLRNCTDLHPGLRTALARELARRLEPGPRRRAKYHAARAVAASRPLDLDEAEERLILLLLDAERAGVFPPGAHLDGLWELAAVVFEKFRLGPEKLSPRMVAKVLAGRPGSN